MSERVIARDIYRNKIWIHSYKDHEFGLLFDLQTDGRVCLDRTLALKLVKELTRFADSYTRRHPIRKATPESEATQ